MQCVAYDFTLVHTGGMYFSTVQYLMLGVNDADGGAGGPSGALGGERPGVTYTENANLHLA